MARSVAVSSGRHYIGSVDATAPPPPQAPGGAGGDPPAVYRSAHQREVRAWRPQPSAEQHGGGRPLGRRRRLFGGGGSPPSIGICLPEACGATDVKVFVGYYFFFLECADRLELAGGRQGC
jgi:hypothetical protein